MTVRQFIPRKLPDRPEGHITLSAAMQSDFFVIKFYEGTAIRLTNPGTSLGILEGDKTSKMYNLELFRKHYYEQVNQDLPANPDIVLQQCLNWINDRIREGRLRVEPIYLRNPWEIEAEKVILEQQGGYELADLNLYYFVICANNQAGTLLNIFNFDPNISRIIELAEPQFITEGAQQNLPDSYEAKQLYIKYLGVEAARDQFEAKTPLRGQEVRVYMLDQGWFTNHPDLQNQISLLNTIPKNVGLESNNPDHNNHGLMVAGIIAAPDNEIGIVGIANKAQLIGVPVRNSGGLSIQRALEYIKISQSTSRGDIILIEQQISFSELVINGPKPQTEGVVVEEQVSVVDKIRELVNAGYVVIEAAGNGGHDLANSASYSTKNNSGAIIVGAGLPYGSNAGEMGAPIGDTCYGIRVDVQGWGRMVFTLDNTANPPYGYFEDTSSAAALVAGIAACLQSAYKQKTGSFLKSPKLRDLLKRTGLPQPKDTTIGPGVRLIGPLPNLYNALSTFL